MALFFRAFPWAVGRFAPDFVLFLCYWFLFLLSLCFFAVLFVRVPLLFEGLCRELRVRSGPLPEEWRTAVRPDRIGS